MNRRRFLQTGAAALTTASLLTLTGSSVRLKLGKTYATPERVALKLHKYVSDAPAPPDNFGHQAAVTSAWGMLGNDTAGDCVLAGACHEHMLWTAEAGCVAAFTQDNAFAAYTELTGFQPGVPSTDKGTNVSDALAYRVKTGITDASGNIHRLEGYAAVNPAADEIAQAAWLFSAVGVGIKFPSYAMQQFNEGLPWDIERGGYIEGGHYVPVIAREDGTLFCVTWGKLQPMTERFLDKYCDEAYALFDTEFFTNGKSPEGFDEEALRNDMAALTA